MDMHTNWNLMIGMRPVMEAFEKMKEHLIPFHPCLLHYLHFIMNLTLVVVQDHECECYSMAMIDGNLECSHLMCIHKAYKS